MLPSIDWWEFENNNIFHNALPDTGPHLSTKDIRLFIGANESTLWPNHINKISFPPDCNPSMDLIPGYCPKDLYTGPDYDRIRGNRPTSNSVAPTKVAAKGLETTGPEAQNKPRKPLRSPVSTKIAL